MTVGPAQSPQPAAYRPDAGFNTQVQRAMPTAASPVKSWKS